MNEKLAGEDFITVWENVIEDEMVKTSQQLSKYGGETESTLSNITWDDYNSGSY